MTLSGHPIPSQPLEKRPTSSPDPGQLTHLRYAREELCDVNLPRKTKVTFPCQIGLSKIQRIPSLSPCPSAGAGVILARKSPPNTPWISLQTYKAPWSQRDLANSASILYARIPICIQVTCASPKTMDCVSSPLDTEGEKVKSRQSGTQV